MAEVIELKKTIVSIAYDLDFTIDYLTAKYKENLHSINRIIDKMQDKSIARALNKNRSDLIEIKSLSVELERKLLVHSEEKGYLLKNNQQLTAAIDETEAFVRGLHDSNKLVDVIENLDKNSIINAGAVDLDPDSYEMIVSYLRTLKTIGAEFLANATALSKTVKNLGFVYQSIA